LLLEGIVLYSSTVYPSTLIVYLQRATHTH